MNVHHLPRFIGVIGTSVGREGDLSLDAWRCSVATEGAIYARESRATSMTSPDRSIVDDGLAPASTCSAVGFIRASRGLGAMPFS